MEAFNAFGGTIDVEVLVVDNADFVIVAEIGVVTLLREQIKAECRVFLLYREHGHKCGTKVYLHCKPVVAVRLNAFGMVENHGNTVVGEGHVVAVGAPYSTVVGNKDEQCVGKPRLLACHAHEASNRPIGVFHYLFVNVLAVGLELDVLRNGVWCMVAARHDSSEEWTLGSSMVAMFYGIVEHNVVGASPCTKHLGG